jgi:hypothetical protein
MMNKLDTTRYTLANIIELVTAVMYKVEGNGAKLPEPTPTSDECVESSYTESRIQETVALAIKNNLDACPVEENA